jgi:hypothetical protein
MLRVCVLNAGSFARTATDCRAVLTATGTIELGLRKHVVEALECRLAELPARTRGAIAW